MSQGINRKLLLHLRNVIEEKEHFPIGVLVYFGPDDEKITKVIAVVISNQTSTPILKTWVTPDFKTDSKVVKDIAQYFLVNEISEVLMTDGVVGCPHDEGIDYPMGETCPHCPFWAEYQE